MPAAAVIPAPIAYIKFAAVKASVVGFRSAGKWPENLVFRLFSVRTWASKGFGSCWPRYFEQIGVLQASYRLNSSAWNNKIRLWSFLLVTWTQVMIDKDIWGRLYSLERGEILRPSEDKQVRKHSPNVFLLIKDESWGIEDD